MKQVTKEEYYKSFLHLDAVISLQGNWPYTVIWSLRNGKILAKSTEEPNGNKKYYIS